MAQFNFRLFLKPTAIGKAIIERLSADGAERQADSRRWIELGYALEQAGFRLDGTTLYLGGRPFAVEQTLPVQVSIPVRETAAARAPRQQESAAVAESGSGGAGRVAAPADPTPTPAVSPTPSAASAPASQAEARPVALPPPPQPAADDDELANNLRGLSA